MSYFQRRLKSFSYAFRGWKVLFQTQPNAILHLIATTLVIALGYYFSLNLTEWLLVIIAITLVLVAEAFNSGIEFLADAVSKEHNELIKKAKDLGAGAVLLAALAALVIGLLIFLPKI